MIDTKCAICGNNKNTKVLYKETLDIKKINSKIFSARRIPDRTHYRFLKCEKCGMIFSNPIMSENKIGLLYSDSDFNYNAEAEYLKKTYFRYFKKYLLKNNSKNIKVLEIGCGNGFFLEELVGNEIKNVYGIEPGKASVEKADKEIKKNIKISILRKGLFPKEIFDIICCFHTLDHVTDPNEFISTVYSLLKKGGKIFFIVHNTNALSVKMFGEKSPIFDIEHIYLFDSKSLKTVFQKSGFSNLKVFNVSNTYPLQYWLKLFPMFHLLKVNILKLFNITKLGLFPISLNAGNIGIVGSK